MITPTLDLQAAAPAAIAQAMGATLKAHIKRQGTISAFAGKTGLSRTALYRLFEGETVGSDVLITVLQGLGRLDALEALLAPPKINPMSELPKQTRASRKAYGTTHQKPIGFDGFRVAEPQKSPKKTQGDKP